MSNTRKRIAAGVAVAGLLALSACSTTTDPDMIGLYYNQGVSDGNSFDHCTATGGTESEWNNQIVFLPLSLRTWNIAGNNGDQAEPIVVATKPEPNQPSGVQVNVWTQTAFKLNTRCDNGKQSPVVKFWETIGRRYAADTPDGWKNMLRQTLIPALEKSIQDVIRSYPADDLVGNVGGVRAEAQAKIAKQVSEELKRLTGFDFFCGPTFNGGTECPALELIIKDVDYNDPGIQQARNEKQKNIELAAAAVAKAEGEARALVAEANGKRDAAAALAGLYRDPNWVALQKQITAANALVEACKQAKECKLVVGSDGNLVMIQ